MTKMSYSYKVVYIYILRLCYSYNNQLIIIQ